ncbi:MAG: tRNA pseudouridine(38-40) synthase TruA, partial [Candidatus Hodarchaeales archaeon]
MNRWAIRVAYFGESYYGFQRQPNLPTVEEKLLNALQQADLVDLGTLRDHHYANAARTDRGVNALEQTIAFNAAQTPNLNQINTYLPNSIFLWAMSEVPQTFHPRNSCYSKTYEYYHYDRTSSLDLVAMRKSAEMLKGTHNFRNFARYDPKRNQDFVRTISSLEVICNEPLLI